MLRKLVTTFALVLLFMPHEPDIGLGRPAAILPAAFQRLQTAMLHAVDEVRADLKANRGAR